VQTATGIIAVESLRFPWTRPLAAGGSRQLASVGHDRDRTRCVVRDLGAHRAEQEALGGSETARPDDEERRVGRLLDEDSGGAPPRS